MKSDWQELETSCLACRSCSLWESRTKLVFGVGKPDAEVMFIGEGPGAEEDKQGEPFVGRAGRLLDDMLKMIDLDRSLVYITNIVKCRPPNNRDPLNTEQAACIGWLRRQIELVNPKIIVCLGRIAAGTMIRADYKISKEHGQWTDIDGIRFTALYHPAALLRNPKLKPETFVDLKNLKHEITALCPGMYRHVH